MIAGAASADVEIGYPAPGVYPEIGPGYVYYYDSLVQDPVPGDPTYYYYWEIDNFSTDFSIVSWTWAGGNVLDLGDFEPEGDLPLAPADDVETYAYRQLFDPNAPTLVPSIIKFSDGHEEAHDIYVPVPEPGSLTVLLSSLGGLALLRRKR